MMCQDHDTKKISGHLKTFNTDPAENVSLSQSVVSTLPIDFNNVMTNPPPKTRNPIDTMA